MCASRTGKNAPKILYSGARDKKLDVAFCGCQGQKSEGILQIKLSKLQEAGNFLILSVVSGEFSSISTAYADGFIFRKIHFFYGQQRSNQRLNSETKETSPVINEPTCRFK